MVSQMGCMSTIVDATYKFNLLSSSDKSSVHVVSDESETAWEALFVPSASSHRDPNRAPTVVALDTLGPRNSSF